MQHESNKIIKILKSVKEQHLTFMEETWDERIPLECSTPKMSSCIGQEMEKEFRRNSISMAKGFKRKGFPLNGDKTTQKIRHNSGNDLFNFVRKELLNKKNTEVEGDQNHLAEKNNTKENPKQNEANINQNKENENENEKDDPNEEKEKKDENNKKQGTLLASATEN